MTATAAARHDPVAAFRSRFAHLSIRERIMKRIGTRDDGLVRIVAYVGCSGDLPYYTSSIPLRPHQWAEHGARLMAVQAERAAKLREEAEREPLGASGIEAGVEVFQPAQSMREAA